MANLYPDFRIFYGNISVDNFFNRPKNTKERPKTDQFFLKKTQTKTDQFWREKTDYILLKIMTR